jgi:hypothetical protein
MSTRPNKDGPAKCDRSCPKVSFCTGDEKRILLILVIDVRNGLELSYVDAARGQEDLGANFGEVHIVTRGADKGTKEKWRAVHWSLR